MADIRVQFFEDGHQYLLNGSHEPSVTTILDAEGLAGCIFYTEQDRNRGTAVHKIAHLMGRRAWRGTTVEEIVTNSLWDPAGTPNVRLHGYGFALAKYYLESGFRPYLVEQPVGSLVWRICGTLDQWGKMPNGKRRLVDFKSGRPEPAANIQTALYEMCLKETLGYETDERQVVWLQADGQYKAYPCRPSGGLDLIAGQSAINLYRWRKENGKL